MKTLTGQIMNLKNDIFLVWDNFDISPHLWTTETQVPKNIEQSIFSTVVITCFIIVDFPT